MRKNVKTELEKAFRKAERFRRENKDIPKLAEICNPPATEFVHDTIFELW